MIKEERETQMVDLDNRHPHGNVPSSEYGWKQELRNQGDWEIKPLENGDFEVKYDLDTEKLKVDWNIQPSDTFMIYEPTPGPLCELFQSEDHSHHFVMYNNDSELLVDVNLDDGTVVFGDAYCPDEASQAFWETIGKLPNRPVEEAIAEYEEEIKLDTRTLIADANPLAGWTIEEEIGEGEVNEDTIKDIVKDIQATHFDKSIEGLIDG
jgi:hypothetical protein